MRYEEMPPPSPEQEAEFHARFRKIMREIAAARISGPEPGQTVQASLTEQGATIPDVPEWKGAALSGKIWAKTDCARR